MLSRIIGALSVLALTSALIVTSSVPSTASGTTCTVDQFDSGSSGSTTLRDCIQTTIGTTADATVVFAHGDTAKTITVSSTVEISGPGLTISDPDGLITITRSNDFDLFQIDLDESTQADSITTFEGVTLEANSGTSSGRAISGVDLQDDDVQYGVALDSVTVEGFSNDDSGGAVEAGDVTVSNDSLFRSNSSESSGGAIRAYGNLTVTDSIFIDNSCTDYGGAARAGGEITITNSSFTGNSADGDGGAIAAGDTVLIQGTASFISNTADDDGGAVFSEVSVNVSGNALFHSNYAGDDGGATYSSSDSSVENASFLNNKAHDKGGAVYASSGFVDVDSTAFFGNEAEDHGGAIRSNGGTVLNSTFFDNKTTNVGQGGAIYIDKNSDEPLAKYLAYNTFVNNFANTGDASITINNPDVSFFANVIIGSNSEAQIDRGEDFDNSWSIADLGANVSTGADSFLDASSSKVSVDRSSLNYGVPSSPTLGFRPFVPIASLGDSDVVVTQALATNFETTTSKTLPTVDQQGNARTFGTVGFLPGAQYISSSTNTAFASTEDTLVATMYEIEDRSFYINDDAKTVTGDEYFYRLTKSDGTLVDLSSTAGMTGPLSEVDQDNYYVSKLNYAANSYEWEWMVFFCEAANEITDSIPAITYSKQDSAPEGSKSTRESAWSSENWSAPAGSLETFQLIDLPDGYTPTSSNAFTYLRLADSTNDLRMTISKHSATAACPSGENPHVKNLKVSGTEVTSRSLDLSQEFQVDVGGVDKDIDLVGRSVAVYGVSGPNYVPAASHFGITTIVEGQIAPASPAPYSGPVITRVGSSAGAFQTQGGENITVFGERLSTVSKVFVGGLEGEVISTSAESFVMTIPEGLSGGSYDLVIQSSLGNLTYLDAFRVSGPAGTNCIDEPMSYWTTRISDSQAKVYIKCPELDSKIRILHQTGGSGEYDVPFVKTLSSLDDPSLVINEFGTYIVRTIELEDINRIRIRIDDLEVWKVRYNR